MTRNPYQLGGLGVTNPTTVSRRTLVEFADKISALPVAQTVARQDTIEKPAPGYEDAWQKFQENGKPAFANGVVFWPIDIFDPAADAWDTLAKAVKRSDVFPPKRQATGLETVIAIRKLVEQFDLARIAVRLPPIIVTADTKPKVKSSWGVFALVAAIVVVAAVAGQR